MEKIDKPETIVKGNDEITDLEKDLELKILEIQSTNEISEHGLETYYGVRVNFPGSKYEIVKRRPLEEYAVVSALKNDFDRWKLQLAKLPNSKKDNANLLKSIEESTFAIGIDSGNTSTLSSTYERYRVEMINAVKKYPDELRLYTQFRGKERLKKIILLEKDSYIKKILNLYLIEICIMIDPDFQGTTELQEISDNLEVNKSKLTRRQKIALLESVGVMKYLEDVFSGNQTATASFLNRVINEDLQNIRKDINKAPESLLKDPKIIKVIDPILMGLGLKNKD